MKVELCLNMFMKNGIMSKYVYETEGAIDRKVVLFSMFSGPVNNNLVLSFSIP